MTSPPERPPRVQATIRITPELQKWLRDYAHRTELSHSDVVEGLLYSLKAADDAHMQMYGLPFYGTGVPHAS